MIESVGPADKVDGPVRRRDDRRQGAGRLPGLHRPVHDPRPAGRRDPVADRPGRHGQLRATSRWRARRPTIATGLTPEFEVASVLDLPDTVAEERRRSGFTDLLAAPAGAIATGQSALVSLGGLPRRESIVRSPVALAPQRPAAERPAARRRTPADDAADDLAERQRRGAVERGTRPR